MPWFRFIGDARVTLPFRNGTCELTFANLGGQDGWAWVAQENGKPADQIVRVQRGNVIGLQVALTSEGFDVPAGCPAEKVMCAAVKCGYAEELPDDKHWRQELILARNAATRRG